MKMRLAGLAVAAMMIGLFGGGCAGGMGKYNVRVEPSPTLRDRNNELPTMEVDLVGVNETQVAAWEAYPVSTYFSGSDPRRQEAIKATMVFTNEKPGAQTLLSNDPIWQRWASSGATKLVVLANIPGVRAQPGAPDPRRVILPLDRGTYTQDTIDLHLLRSGVENRTPMKVK